MTDPLPNHPLTNISNHLILKLMRPTFANLRATRPSSNTTPTAATPTTNPAAPVTSFFSVADLLLTAVKAKQAGTMAATHTTYIHMYVYSIHKAYNVYQYIYTELTPIDSNGSYKCI